MTLTSGAISSQQTLHLLAHLLATLRDYFAKTNAVEVVTPVLARAAVTDPNIHSLQTSISGDMSDGTACRYLHTSAEYPMKQLLADGVGDIYQLCKVFRGGESGRLHNPEFLMCEWYRVGSDHLQLMQEVDALLHLLWSELAGASTLTISASDFISYSDALQSTTGIGLATITVEQIEAVLKTESIDSPLSEEDSLDTWLDLLMSTLVCTKFKTDRFTFLYDYPASQAALAKTAPDGSGLLIAQRFEVFFGKVELANGFHELTDPIEQRSRFENELSERQRQLLPAVPIDEQLLDALTRLPDCAGVALGIERLLMVILGKESLSEVITGYV